MSVTTEQRGALQRCAGHDGRSTPCVALVARYGDARCSHCRRAVRRAAELERHLAGKARVIAKTTARKREAVLAAVPTTYERATW